MTGRFGVLLGVPTMLASLLAGPAAPASAVSAADVPGDRIVRARATQQGSPSRLRWSAAACSDAALDTAHGLPAGTRMDCTVVRVPVDRSRSRSGTIGLRVTRVRSTAPGAGTRTLFVNPGGPGVTADWMAPAMGARFPALLGTHTIVAMDPRGTEGSSPLDCAVITAPVDDVRQPTTAEARLIQDAAADTVKRCAQAYPRLLPHVSTAATAADLDAVRAALGAEVIDWYGVSAGTWLGARYAEAYPTRIDRLVLDSTLDLTSTWRTAFSWQPRGFQRRYGAQFLPWVARHHADYGLGTTTRAVRASVEGLRRRAAQGLLGSITPADLDTLIAEQLYDDDTFPGLADDLSILAQGPSTGRIAAIRQGMLHRPHMLGLLTAEDGVFMAVQCNDSAWTTSQASYLEEGRTLGAAYPLVGWTWISSPCATWPYPARPLSPLAPHSLPAGLVLQNELDPATPWEGARRTWQSQRNLRVVAVDDEGSHGVLFGDNTCAVRAGLTYLRTGRLPARNTVCAGVPLPDETTTRRVTTPLRLADLR